MTPDEATRVLARMAVVWPQHALDEAEALEWRTTLAPLPAAAAAAAIDQLKAETAYFPSHQEFLVAAQALARRMAAERQLDAPPDRSCHRCGSTGWREVATRSGHPNTVAPCSCVWATRKTPRRTDEDHARDCSCSRCHYGARRAAAIAAGLDAGAEPADLRPVGIGEEEF